MIFLFICGKPANINTATKNTPPKINNPQNQKIEEINKNINKTPKIVPLKPVINTTKKTNNKQPK